MYCTVHTPLSTTILFYQSNHCQTTLKLQLQNTTEIGQPTHVCMIQSDSILIDYQPVLSTRPETTVVVLTSSVKNSLSTFTPKLHVFTHNLLGNTYVQHIRTLCMYCTSVLGTGVWIHGYSTFYRSTSGSAVINMTALIIQIRVP